MISAPAEGTRRMAANITRITRQTDPRTNLFMNTGRAKVLEAALATESPENQMPILWALGRELLNAGRTDDAIARFEQLDAAMTQMGLPQSTKEWVDLRVRQGIAHLRRAEEDNCVEHHNPDSCIFPVRGSGVHVEKRGSREAAAILGGVLEKNPDELQARWLLNIAYMTLGEYPAGVPARWLIDPKLFESEYDIKRFPDVAGSVGLDVDDLAGGSIVDDFDLDGYLDVMASSQGLSSQIRYFRNEADGTFTERTDEAGLTGLFGGLNIVQTDYNNDGYPDALVLRGGWMGAAGHYPNSLLRNDGDGTFTDVTEEAGMLSFHPKQTAVWLDYDGDGWLDVFIGNETTAGDPNPCELFHNNRDGTFTECAQPSGVTTMDFVKGVTSGDFNNDGRPDLYASVKNGPNRLYRNDGPSGVAADAAGPCGGWRFTDVAAAAGVVEPLHSFPTWFWDYDNDGWEDLFVSGYGIKSSDIPADVLGIPHNGERPRLYRNNHDGTFADVTKEAGLWRMLLAMGSNFGDLDNDGWLDFYVGTGDPDLGNLLPNRAFRNDQGRRFQDVTTSGGLGHLQKGHGVSFADLDNDGDQDIYQVVGGAFEADHFRNALFENPGHGNHWIVLKLEGTKSNRPGIGARIKVVVRTPQGERAIHRTVRSGGSFGASPLRQHIGLGDAREILRAEILWPAGGPAQVFEALEMDGRYLVREGDPKPTPIRLKTFRLGRHPDDKTTQKEKEEEPEKSDLR